MVSKEEINETVWRGRIVSDAALSSRIKTARQILGDDGRAQQVIRTIHKKGFRFVAEIVQEDLSYVAVSDSLVNQPYPAHSGSTKPAIAVLPFANLSPETDQEYFSDGITMSAKFWAGIISLPLLTALFDVAGIVGGYLVGVVKLGLGQGTYIQGLYSGIEWNDVAMGIVKSFVFAWIIVWVCAAKGFFLHKQRTGVFGAEGVSRITTHAVVFSSICILFTDYVIGAIML